MKTSSDFQTGGVLLLTATVICGALAVTVIAPLLQRESFARTNRRLVESKQKKASPESVEKFTEFYPSLADARDKLEHFEKVAGPVPPPQTRRRVAHNSKSAGYMAVQQRPSPLPRRSTLPRGAATSTTQFVAEVAKREPAEPVSIELVHEDVPVADVAAKPEVSDPAPVEVVAIPTPQIVANQYPPSQIPSGTVYAPVTVNVDSSAITQQMREFSARFEKLEQQKAQQEAAIEKAERDKLIARRRQRNRQQQVQTAQSTQKNNVPDEKLVRIEAGLRQLAESFNTLQNKTQVGLEELARRAERAEAASQMLESYEQMLDDRIDQLTKISTPPVTRIAEAPTNTYSEGVPFPSQPQLAEPRTFTHQPDPDFAPAPEQNSTEIETNDFLPAIESEPQAEVEDPFPPATTPNGFSVTETELLPSVSSDNVLPIESAESVEILTPREIATPLELHVPEQAVSDVDNAEQLRSVDEMSETNLLVVPPAHLSEVAATPVTQPSGVTPPPVPAIAAPVPDLPVGFEQVYRFKLSNVEPGPAVVPGDGPVCQHCGRVHANGEKHNHAFASGEKPEAKLIQASATSGTAEVQAATPTPQSSVVEQKTPSKRISNRTAGRGTNRHVRAANGQSDDKPVWDVELPTFGRKAPSERTEKQPNMLQRMGSTLMKFTK